jgi:hypothetical protein
MRAWAFLVLAMAGLGLSATPARAQNIFTLQLYNTDDLMTARITNSFYNGQIVLQNAYAQDTGAVNITSFVKPGLNDLNIQDYNNLGGWGYGYIFKENGVTIAQGSCGFITTAPGAFGCNGNSQTQTNQVVFNTDIIFQDLVSPSMNVVTTSVNSVSQQYQNVSTGVGTTLNSLTNYLANNESSAEQNGIPGPPFNPGPNNFGDNGPPTDNPNGGADSGSGGFDPGKYGSGTTLADPSGSIRSQYAAEPAQPLVFKAMPPVGSASTRPADPAPYYGFLMGYAGTTPFGGGSMGIRHAVWPGVDAGATIGATTSQENNLLFGGSSRTNTGSVNVFLDRMPSAGLQWLVAANAQYAALAIARGYLDLTGAPVTSSGNTDSQGIGATARLGWVYQTGKQTTLTPFGSITVSRTWINAYNESNGPFPMQFNAVAQNNETTRLGFDGSYALGNGRTIWGTVNWAHSFEGTTPGISGMLIGLFPLAVPGAPVAQDWAEVTGGIRVALQRDSSINASVSASVFQGQPTIFQATLTYEKKL